MLQKVSFVLRWLDLFHLSLSSKLFLNKKTNFSEDTKTLNCVDRISSPFSPRSSIICFFPRSIYPHLACRRSAWIFFSLAPFICDRHLRAKSGSHLTTKYVMLACSVCVGAARTLNFFKYVRHMFPAKARGSS